ncbi:MAG: hypothetical protein ACRDH5_13110, partial [bacterium]
MYAFRRSVPACQPLWAIALALAALPAGAQITVTNCLAAGNRAQYSVCQIPLTFSGTYANPYTNATAQVTATFRLRPTAEACTSANPPLQTKT